MARTVLLSGRPGIGKTTLIKKVIDSLPGRSGGFYTQEIRREGRRVGFEIVTLQGSRATLAHIERAGGPRVSKYRVDVENVTAVAVPAIQQAVAEAEYVVIDEIGRMELFSAAFQEAVTQAISSPKSVLGTVMSKPNTFVDSLRRMPTVDVVEVTVANRDTLAETILRMLTT